VQSCSSPSRTLRSGSLLGGATVFPAVISIPEDMSRDSLRLGMSGRVTAFSSNAGVIGLLASILVLDQLLYRVPLGNFSSLGLMAGRQVKPRLLLRFQSSAVSCLKDAAFLHQTLSAFYKTGFRTTRPETYISDAV
jgi:hypothetical protein